MKRPSERRSNLATQRRTVSWDDIQNAQIAAMLPGASASDVDAVLRKGLIDSGFGARHGLNFANHEHVVPG